MQMSQLLTILDRNKAEFNRTTRRREYWKKVLTLSLKQFSESFTSA